MWFDFLLFLLKPVYSNDLIIAAGRVVGKEALHYLLIGVNKQVGVYSFLDFDRLNLYLNGSSLKNLYMPLNYNLETFYHAKVPYNNIFFLTRLVKYFNFISHFVFFMHIGIAIICNIFFFNFYLYLMFFYKNVKKHFLFYVAALRGKKHLKRTLRKLRWFVGKQRKIRKKFGGRRRLSRRLRARLNFVENFSVCRS